MNKLYLLFIFLAASLCSAAQTVDIRVTPGTSVNVVIGPSNYHVSESIYTETEIGAGNFTTPGTSIDKINFFIEEAGSPTMISNFEIYMRDVPLATTTYSSGTYSVSGYTQVFSGMLNAPSSGLAGVTLTTPFVRTPGNNLEVLIVRYDNVVHSGYILELAAGNTVGGVVNPGALSSRRYNSTAAPSSGTVLNATSFRPAIQLVNTYPINAEIAFIDIPASTCFSSNESMDVYLKNSGTTNIAPGAAATTLHIAGANSFSGTILNSGTIVPGGIEIIHFTGINLSSPGTNLDTAYVVLAGDPDQSNDTLDTDNKTALVLSSFPTLEDVETTLPVLPYEQNLYGYQLWSVQTGSYSNPDQTTPLAPRSGNRAFIFDSYSGTGSFGYESRLYSNCIDLTNATSALLSFWMSHDNTFLTDLDSLYISISNDKGVTWNRLTGFRRPDPSAVVPLWRLESVNLTGYIGQTIQIGFEGVSKYGNAILVDDITITAALIPVSLLSFDATRNGNTTQLNWRTAQESTVARYVIERSTDEGRNYLPIGEAGARNNASVETYQFIDRTPVKGRNFYRLRIVDFDQQYKFSPVRLVNMSGGADLVIAPNPVRQVLKINLNTVKPGKGIMTIKDMTGRLVYTGNVQVSGGNDHIQVQAAHLSPGLYLLTIQLENEKLASTFSKY